MKYKLEIYKAKNKQWSWRIKARNGRIVAVAGETYKRKSTLMRTFDRLIRGISFQGIAYPDSV